MFPTSKIATAPTETKTEVAGTEVANVPEQQWSNHFDDQPDIVFVDKANVGVSDAGRCREMIAGQLFGLFFTDYLIRLIVGETNRYASQCMKQAPKKGKKHSGWTDVTVPKLKTWLGLMLVMGIVQKKGCLGEYWSTHWLTQTPGSKTGVDCSRT